MKQQTLFFSHDIYRHIAQPYYDAWIAVWAIGINEISLLPNLLKKVEYTMQL